jgi:ketosteroid isomerase-like protein
MRKVSLLFAVTLMALSLQAQINGGVPKIIVQNEREWAAAMKAGDQTRIEPLLANLFVNMDADGIMTNRAQWLGMMQGSKWDINEVSDIQVTTIGDTAIATGTWVGKGTLANGKAVDAHEHWVDTWIKMPNGKWQCVASASAPTKI